MGACTAKLFLSHGAKDDLGQSLCKDHVSSDISYIHCNVTSDSDVKNLIDITMSEHGRLDIMYSNAGNRISGQLVEMAILNAENDDFKRVLEVNLNGSFLCASTPKFLKTSTNVVGKMANFSRPQPMLSSIRFEIAKTHGN
ncbi:hypothetical protein Ancab_013866 [Ancistrocladus abbreviatus]